MADGSISKAERDELEQKAIKDESKRLTEVKNDKAVAKYVDKVQLGV